MGTKVCPHNRRAPQWPVQHMGLLSLTPSVLASDSPFAACFCAFLHQKLEEITVKNPSQAAGVSAVWLCHWHPSPSFSQYSPLNNRWLQATLFVLGCGCYVLLAGRFLCSWELLSHRAAILRDLDWHPLCYFCIFRGLPCAVTWIIYFFFLISIFLAEY